MMNLALMASRAALVLMEKRINTAGIPGSQNPNDTEYVYLKGRKAGIISKLLNLMGIDATTEFYVYEDRIEFRTGSLFGKMHEVYPFESISNLGTGFMKPIALLFIAILLILTGLTTLFKAVIPGIVMIAVAAFFIFLYIHGKTLMLYFISNSGSAAVMLCKKAVIENTEFNEESASQIMAIVEDLIKKTHDGSGIRVSTAPANSQPQQLPPVMSQPQYQQQPPMPSQTAMPPQPPTFNNPQTPSFY